MTKPIKYFAENHTGPAGSSVSDSVQFNADTDIYFKANILNRT
jgi:hypothetical protein